MKALLTIFTSLFYLLLTFSLAAQTEEFKVEYNGDKAILSLGLPNQATCIENIIHPSGTVNYLSLKARNNANTVGLFLGSNGSVLIGEDDPCVRVPPVNATFSIDGTFYVRDEAFSGNGSANFTVISDKRLKKNIIPLEKQKSLEKLKEIKVYDFEYKDSGIKRYGIMAQEIKEILPRTVNTFEKSGSEFYNFNPSDLFYLHINATQELNNIVSNQEEEIVRLKEVNQAIEEKLIIHDSKFNEAVQTFQDTEKELVVTKSKWNDLETKYQALAQEMEALVHNLNTTKNQNANQDTDISISKKAKSKLEQNIPNPTSNETTVNYYLTDEATNAYLTISNITGQIIKQYPLTTKGEGKITIQLKDLSLKGGIYYYELVIDGKSVDSKRMVLLQ